LRCVVVISIGLLVIIRSHSLWQITLGAYLICLGLNYVPMSVFAVSIGNKQNALAELADELQEKHRAMSKYRRLSLLLLLPLLVPLLALIRRRIACWRHSMPRDSFQVSLADLLISRG